MDKKIIDLMSSTLNITADELCDNFGNKEIWDSLSRVEVMFAIEDEFGFQFDEEELANAVTPGMLFEIVMKKVSE